MEDFQQMAFEYSKLYLQEAINRASGYQPGKLTDIARISVLMAYKLKNALAEGGEAIEKQILTDLEFKLNLERNAGAD